MGVTIIVTQTTRRTIIRAQEEVAVRLTLLRMGMYIKSEEGARGDEILVLSRRRSSELICTAGHFDIGNIISHLGLFGAYFLPQVAYSSGDNVVFARVLQVAFSRLGSQAVGSVLAGSPSLTGLVEFV